MRLKKLLIALVVILAVLLVIAGIGTFFNGGVTLEKPKENVSIAMVGDVMFARTMPGYLSADTSPFAGVSNVTSAADLLIINFENAATNSASAVKGDVPLKCSPEYVPLAKANNNTIAALANNHVCDYGIDGMRDTIKYVGEAGMTPMGAGENESDAHQAVTKNVKGRNITVLNYMDSNNFAEYSYEVLPYANGSSPGYSAYNSVDAQKQIADARGNGSDFVIAYMHFGNEYSRSPNEDQERIAHELIDYGADVVVGSNPHVAQGIEMYNKRPIFYSLGDFVSDLGMENASDTYLVKFDLVGDTCNCTVYPVHLNNCIPYFSETNDGNAFLNSLNPHCGELQINNGVGKLQFNLTRSD